MKRTSIRFIWMTSRLDQVWFPAAFWALFLMIAVLRGPEYVFDTARAYLGAVIPLIAGIMAAYAVLDDSALELRFATPVPAVQTMLERLGPVFGIQALTAITFQGIAVLMEADFSPFGGWMDVQLAWFIPTLALMTFGCLMSMISTQTTTGAVLTGMVWIVELVARGWFAYNPVGQYILVFMSPFMVDHPALRANQISLVFFSILFLFAGWRLFERQERYI